MDSAVPTAPAERIGVYEILLPIGRGGAATVYLARQSMVGGIHKNVAIKLMHSDLRASPDAAKELIEEAKLAAAIRHPNVVEILEAGEKAGEVFVAFEYVEGDTLAGVLGGVRRERTTLEPAIAGKILSDALAGLHAAHELRDAAGTPVGLVHRDFSPQNILLGIDGVARLTDFGIAKALTRLSVTRTGIIKGKIGYMSPEQVRGLPLDRRSDVYAAGVVAWEVITGRRLLRGDEVATLEKIVSKEPLPRVRRFRPDLPPAVDAAVARALSKDASSRFDSALEFKTELMKAWHEWARPAELEEVARFVSEEAEPKLVERRHRVREILELRTRMHAISTQVVEEPTTSSASKPPLSKKSRSLSWLIAPIAAAAVGALVFATPRAPARSVASAPSLPSAPLPEPVLSTTAASAAEPTASAPLPPIAAEAPSVRAAAKKAAPRRKSGKDPLSDPNRIDLAPPPYRR